MGFSTEKFAHATNPIHNLNYWHDDVGFGPSTSFRACNGSGVCTDITGQQIGQSLRQNRVRSRPSQAVSHRKGDGFTGEKRQGVQDSGGMAPHNRIWQ
jgi:hypothetical protein